jgi:hypothetical protein
VRPSLVELAVVELAVVELAVVELAVVELALLDVVILSTPTRAWDIVRRPGNKEGHDGCCHTP